MQHSAETNLPLILPIGTAIVLRQDKIGRDRSRVQPVGSVGIVVHAPADPAHQYRIRMVGGDEISATRDDLAVLSRFKTEGLRQSADCAREWDLSRHVIYRCVVGSRAYGLESDASDTDRRGIFLPPATLQWSLYGVPEQVENDATQECYWEIQKFLMLALKANPNVLECLYSPLVEYTDELARRLLGMRDAFLSKLVYQTYNGYAQSQFRKMEQDVRNHGKVRWKHAMHLIRLLLAGIKVLDDGIVAVRVENHRDELLAIKAGQISWDNVNARRLRLHEEFERAFRRTKLPDWPDYVRVNELLLDARGAALSR